MTLPHRDGEKTGGEEQIEEKQQRQAGDRPDQRRPPTNLFFVEALCRRLAGRSVAGLSRLHQRSALDVAMVRITASSLIWSPDNSPTLARSRSTMTRSQERTISSSSEL